MFMRQQQKQNESLFSPVISRSPTAVSSTSSWHPISASPSQDMWELPANPSTMSDDRDDYHASGLHQEFSIYCDTDDYSSSIIIQEQNSFPSLPATITVRENDQPSNHRRDSASASGRNRSSGVGLSGQRCILGDTTNTLRRKNNVSNTTRPIQRSYFN